MILNFTTKDATNQTRAIFDGYFTFSMYAFMTVSVKFLKRSKSPSYIKLKLSFKYARYALPISLFVETATVALNAPPVIVPKPGISFNKFPTIYLTAKPPAATAAKDVASFVILSVLTSKP